MNSPTWGGGGGGGGRVVVMEAEGLSRPAQRGQSVLDHRPGKLPLGTEVWRAKPGGAPKVENDWPVRIPWTHVFFFKYICLTLVPRISRLYIY